MGSELSVDGFDGLLAKLSTFEQDMQDRISKNALQAGAKEIQKAIQAEVRVSNIHELHLRDDIQIGRPTRTDTGWVIKIGPSKKTAWRGALLEFGHMKPGGKGHVPAYPFMNPGLSRSKQNFLQTVAGVIRKEI